MSQPVLLSGKGSELGLGEGTCVSTCMQAGALYCCGLERDPRAHPAPEYGQWEMESLLHSF